VQDYACEYGRRHKKEKEELAEAEEEEEDRPQEQNKEEDRTRRPSKRLMQTIQPWSEYEDLPYITKRGK